MNYLLIAVIVLMGCFGFYEYDELQKQHNKDVFELKEATKEQIEKLQADNQQLSNDKEGMAKQINEDLTKIAGLNDQITKMTAARTATTNTVSNPAASSLPAGPVFSDDLGDLTTNDGKTYPQSHLLKVETTGIVIKFSPGITKVLFAQLPADIQKRFGYDPGVGFLSDTQVQTLETKRLAAETSTISR